MTNPLPKSVDAWRMAAERKRFSGDLRLSKMPRLLEALADDQGSGRFELVFDQDESGAAWLELRVQARLPMICQRGLERFEQLVELDQRLDLVRTRYERDQLPVSSEALMVDDPEGLDLGKVLEDELILALPMIPRCENEPDDGLVWVDEEAREEAVSTAPENPFSVLEKLTGKGS